MAPVLLDYVVRFSSQDPCSGKVDNLLKSQIDPSAGRWTCSKEDGSGRLEGEFQLEKSSYISHVDIGNYGSAFIEVFVGNSMWPPGRDYLSIIPSAVLMTPTDCKQWIQTKTVRMFHDESFNKKVLNEKWDRIRVICHQPYRKDKQFGLSFLRIGAPDAPDLPSPQGEDVDLSTKISAVTPKSNNHKSGQSTNKLKSTPGLMNCLRQLKKSPEAPSVLDRGSKMLRAALDNQTNTPRPHTSRTLLSFDEEQDERDESFRGIQDYTRKAITNWEETTPEIGKKSNNSSSPSDKKWSLNGDIEDEVQCFLEGIDFSKLDLETVTYSDLRLKIESQRGCPLTKIEKKVFIKLAKKVVNSVMEEQKGNDVVQVIDMTAAQKTQVQHSTPRKPPNRVTNNNKVMSLASHSPTELNRKQQVLTSSSSSPSSTATESSATTSDILTAEHPGSSTKLRTKRQRLSPKQSQNSVDSDDDLPSYLSYEPPEKKATSSPSTAINDQSDKPVAPEEPAKVSDFSEEECYVECPICSKFFSSLVVEAHAAACTNFLPDAPSEEGACSSSGEELVDCPICTKKLPASLIIGHANECAEKSLTDKGTGHQGASETAISSW